MANNTPVEAEIRRLYQEEGLGVSKIIIRIKQAFPGGPSYDSKRIRAILAADKSTVIEANKDVVPVKPASAKSRAKGKKPVKADPPLSRAKAEEGIATLIMSRQRPASKEQMALHNEALQNGLPYHGSGTYALLKTTAIEYKLENVIWINVKGDQMKHTLLERMKIEAGLGHLAGTLMLVTVLMDALDTSRQGHLVTYERVCLQIEAEYGQPNLLAQHKEVSGGRGPNMLALKKLMDSVFNGAGPEAAITAKDREMLGAAERLGRRLDAKVGDGATEALRLQYTCQLTAEEEGYNKIGRYACLPDGIEEYDYNAEQGIYWVTVKSPIAEVMEKHKTGSIKGDTKDVYLLFEIIWFLLRSQKGDKHVSRERLARQLKKETRVDPLQYEDEYQMIWLQTMMSLMGPDGIQ